MARKPRRAGISSAPNFVLFEFNSPVGPGVTWPLRCPGFRDLYLPAGSLCLIERSSGRPSRILVLDRSVSPFYPPREFLKMSQSFREAKKEGRAVRWIAFYP